MEDVYSDKNLLNFSERYLELLTGKFATLNLTRILEREEFFLKQIVDSVLPVVLWDHFLKKEIQDAEVVVDVGFGGGFPLLPMAFLFPTKTFIGFEARRKKSDAVNEIAQDLGLKNVRTFHERIENILIDKKTVVTFKAVGKAEDFLKKINTVGKTPVYFLKGPNPSSLEKVNDLKHWENVCNETYELSGAEGRTLLGYVPRGTQKITNKNLVKLSSKLVP